MPRILVAESDRFVLASVDALLSDQGCVCDTACSGPEALEKVKSFQPDIVLLGVLLPPEGGVEICHSLGADPEAMHIPLLAYCPLEAWESGRNCLRAGASDLMAMPLDPAELLAKIRNLIVLREYESIKNQNKMLVEMFSILERAKREWEQTVDCIDDIVIIIDTQDSILRCNRRLSTITQRSFLELLNNNWLDTLKENGFQQHKSASGEIEIYHTTGKWFVCNRYPIKNPSLNEAMHAVITLHDVTELRNASEDLRGSKGMLEKKNLELERAYSELKSAQSKILQQEKMASIGQLAAGIAHEINNPIGYIISNFGTLRKYLDRLREFILAQSDALAGLTAHLPEDGARLISELAAYRESLKIDYVMEDVKDLINESTEGVERVKRIVQDLKSFSRVDEMEWKLADINAGLNSTINIVWNELKYKATLQKEYGELPLTRCNPGQLNQVFMNILVNATQAIDSQGNIIIKTWNDAGSIYVSITDTGSGISSENITRIFEPFFTTKEVGKGTGLGLSIVYDIVKKHGGEISVESKEGKGTTFTIRIPIVDMNS